MKHREVLMGTVLLSVFAGPVYAQGDAPAAQLPLVPVEPTGNSAGPSPVDNGKDRLVPRIMEEIVVTAQKREENLQDVPVSITAFSAEQMDARGITDVKGLGPSTPSLQFTDFAGYTLIYLRGVGTDTFIPSADPSVATYLDGMYFPAAHSLGQSFGALERIEVLKGPQGTLFGRNSTGGAISIVTKKPGNVFEGDLQSSVGNYDDIKTRVYANIPLTDWLATSVSGFYNTKNSYYTQDHAGLPNELPRDIAKGARLKLGFYPADDLELVLTGLQTRQQGSTAAIGVNTHPSLLVRALYPGETRDYVTANDNQPYVATNIDALYGQATYKAPWFDVRLLGSNFHIKTFDYKVDFDGTPYPLVTSQSPNEYQDLQSGELQIVSNADGPGASWLKWIGGLYYYKSEGGYAPVHLSVANSVINLPTGAVSSVLDEVTARLLSVLPQAGQDALNGVLGALPFPSQVGLNLFGAVGTKSYSAYLQSTVTVTDGFDITLGGRYQKEKRSLVGSDVTIDNEAGGQTTLISFAPRASTSTNFSPKVSLDWHPLDDVLLYTSFSQGYKSATYNVVNLYEQPDYVKPEQVTAYELGAKATLLSGALRLNTAVFQNKIKDLQASFVSLLAGGAVNFENAGSARIRGVELDTTWLILPDLGQGLVLTLGGSYLDALYTDFKNGSGFDNTTGLYSANNDFTGNRISRVPKYTYNVGLGQSLAAPGGSMEIGADYAYNSGFYFLAQNTPNSREPAYGLVNARLSYLYEPWNARLTAFCDNAGDKKYRVSQFFTDFGRLDTLAPPRTYGLRLNWKF